MAVGVMKGLINRGSRTRRTFVNKCLSHARYPMFYTAHFHTGTYILAKSGVTRYA